MRTLIWSNTFIRASKRVVRKQPDLRQDIENTLRLLVQDPFAPQLETHKLKGKLSGSWACSAGCDLRIIFDFVKNKENKEDDIFLIEIGTHDEVIEVKCNRLKPTATIRWGGMDTPIPFPSIKRG